MAAKRYLVTLGLLGLSLHARASEKFWGSTPRGANISATNPDSDLQAARKFGIRLLRIGATGSPGDLRYLVQGGAPNEVWDLSEEKLGRLKHFVSRCENEGLKVVISLAHIPGRNWAYRERDHRFWHEERYRQEFVRAWQKIARSLKGTKSVVGFDLINEPYFPKPTMDRPRALYRKLLNALYVETATAIRKVDSQTTLIVESPGMASPDTFDQLDPLDDSNVVYSFHYYEPFHYFSPPLNQGNYEYPGLIPDEEGGVPVHWDLSRHQLRFDSVIEWQKKHKIPGSRIFVGEFGVWRKARGNQAYLRDVLSIFGRHGWSWAYYAFRENDWDVADLELDDQAGGRVDTPLFQILRANFQ